MNKRLPYFLILLFFLSVFSKGVSAEQTLTWRDCIEEAKKNHPDLISAVEVVNQDKAAKAITASGLFPQVDADFAASTQKSSGSSTVDSYSYGVSATQLVFDGLKTVNNVNAAKETIKADQQGYSFTSSQIRLNLRTAFVKLLKAQELIRVAEEIVKIRRSNLQLITLRYYSGLEHRGALLTAEANLASAEYDLAQAKRDIESAQREMTKEMGRREFIPMLVEGDFTVIETVKEEPELEKLALVNPAYLQALAQKNSAAFAVKSAYANFSPEVSGSAGAGKSGAKWPPEEDDWNLGLSASLPLFEGGLRQAQLNQAKALFRQRESDLRSIKDAAIVNLRLAWATLQDALEEVGVQRKTLEADEERSRIAEGQYSTGFIGFDNWIIIEDNLVAAKKSYLQSQANALLAEAGWIKAKGETLEYAP